MADLGNIGPDMFVDACLLSGSALLPTLPELASQSHRKPSGIRRAVDMMMSTGRTGIDVCLHYRDVPQFRAMNYLDRYKRARLAVKHHVVLTADGKVEPLDVKTAPGDMHNVIGQRLPDEIYLYLSRGVIGPRVLNWRTSGEIIELPPLDNGDSEDFRTFVRDQLTELRKTSLSTLSHSLHRFYQHNDVTLRCWFDPSNARVIGMKDLPDPKPLLAKWNYKRDLTVDDPDKFKVYNRRACVTVTSGHPHLPKAGHGNHWRCRTQPTRSRVCQHHHHRQEPERGPSSEYGQVPHMLTCRQLIRTKFQFHYNTMCRLLHLRGYVNDKHCLTQWGQVLHAALSSLDGNPQLEEPVFVAIELARLNLLTAKNMFPTYTGAPFRGSGKRIQALPHRPDLPAVETDQRNTLLVSRVACLGQLRHKIIGYTGPLSRYLLAYHSMISAVRNDLHDLADVCLTTLLLNGDGERNRKILTDIGLR